ncbi:ethionine resistance-conferring protein 1 [Diutina rugosa]
MTITMSSCPTTSSTPLLAQDLEDAVVDHVHDRRRRLQILPGSLEADSTLVTHSYECYHDEMSASIAPDVSDILSRHSIASVGEEPTTSFKNESTGLIFSSIPVAIASLCQYSLTVASVFSVGRLGSAELAAISLSSMTANISGYAIIQGVATSLDTLCPQAYGRKEFNWVGVHFFRCTILLLFVSCPIMLFWIFGSYRSLVYFVHDHELASYASLYLRVIAFGVPAFILFENAKHFLQAQGLFNPSAYILGICAPINAILNYVLVWDRHIGLGFIGAPLSVVITNYLMCFMIYIYIYVSDGRKCWPHQAIFHPIYWSNWKRMINLAIPGVLMVESEWLAFEVITLEASRFGTTVLAAQSIINTTCVLLYQIPFALSIATSTRIAWYVGAASERASQTCATVAVSLSLVSGSIFGALLYMFRYQFASLYTDDTAIIALAGRTLIIASVYQVFDFLSCATGGIMRGQGRQQICGFVSLGSYYTLGLPCAYIFGFVLKWELTGLWVGMIIALMTISMTQMYFVRVSNWKVIINEAAYEECLDSSSIANRSETYQSLNDT